MSRAPDVAARFSLPTRGIVLAVASTGEGKLPLLVEVIAAAHGDRHG